MKPNDNTQDLLPVNGESDVDSLENSNSDMLEESGSSGCGSDVEEEEEGSGSDDLEEVGSGCGSDDDAGSGSGDWSHDSYTEEEYLEMLKNGTWHGGYVNGVYVMPEVTAEGDGDTSGGNNGGTSGGTSGGSSGGSNAGTSGGNNGGTTGGNNGQGGESENPQNNGVQQGGSSQNNNQDQTPNHDVQIGSFLDGEEYYTEEEMESMHELGTWQGGNVFTLGYVGADYNIDSRIPRHQIPTEWYSCLGDFATDILGKIANICSYTMSLPYVQATRRYNEASGQPLTLNVNNLGLQNLTRNMLDQDKGNPNKYSINLLEHIDELTYGIPYNQKILVVNTAITLGNITLIHVGDNQYGILDDTYDFDLENHEGEYLRNFETILGFIVQEGICMFEDASHTPFIGGLTLKSVYIANGIFRRHITGNTTFNIQFSGTIYIQP